MAGIDQNTLWQLASMILGKSKAQPTTRERATFLRTDSDGTQWVRLPSSNDETPVNGRTLATAKAGDTVEWSIDNGRLSITGNSTSPSVGSDYVGQEVSVVTKRVDAVKADIIETNELLATKATITELEAESARIDTIEADVADIDTIRANSAKVQNLTAVQLEADHAKVSQLDVSQIEADHATIGNLDTTYMHANMSNSDVAWIENGTIKDGAIVSAMINDVSANKLTAGTINGSVINVTNLNADNITTGTINGQRIGEGSLSLDKLSENVYTESEVDNIVDGLNDRIDGAIETHTGTAVPTLNNQPASSWNTTKLRDEHVGDVYYVVNSQSQQNGYCYRFTKSGSTYSWQLIKDSDVTAALSRLTTAEGKITTFDSDISTLKTDTVELKTKTQSLETSLGDKVDTTTFNELEDTVDSHSQTISQHTTAISNKADSSTVTAVTNRVSKNEQDISGINTTIGELQDTVETKADGSTVETVSNRLNTVSNTVDGHTQTLTSVQNTLSSKADSSTVSTLQEDYATYKQTTTENVSSIGSRLTTAEGKISSAETAIEQTANNVLIKATQSDTTAAQGGQHLIESLINVAPSGVTINANKINLQGAVTISDLNSDAQSATLNSNIVGGGENLIGRFNYKLGHSCVYDYLSGTITSTTTTNTRDNSVYVQFYTGTTTSSVGTFVRQLDAIGSSANVGQLLHATFEKSSDYTHIRLKFNGDKADSGVFWDASSIADGTELTLSFTLKSISSDGKGNGGVLSGVNLRTGNMPSRWSLAPQDQDVHTGGRNYAKTNFERFPIGKSETRQSGVTATITGPSTFTLNGTATTTDWLFSAAGVFGGLILQTGTYKVWCTSPNVNIRVGVGSLGGTWFAAGIHCTKDNPFTLEITTEQAYYFTPYASVGDSYSNQEVRLMVELSDHPTDWTPAPEDVDSAISVAQSTAIEVSEISGRNLSAVLNYEEGYLQSGAQNLGAMNAARKEHTSAYIPVIAGETYVFQNWVTPPTGSGNYLWMAYQLYDSSKALVGGRPSKTAGANTGLPQHETYVVTIPTGVAFIRISARLYSDGKMKLEKGSTATDWSPALEDVGDEISDAAKTATSYVTDITGGGIMVHPSDDATSGVRITSDVDIMRGGTSAINIGTNDAVRIGVDDNAHVKMLLESDSMEIDNEVGDQIFVVEANRSGTTTETVTANDVAVWSGINDVTTATYTITDAGTTSGTATAIVTVDNVQYELDSSQATTTVTVGSNVTATLTSSGVTYVRGLMTVVEEDEEGVETTTYLQCSLSVRYVHIVADSAIMALDGRQVINGERKLLTLSNDQWSSSNETDNFVFVETKGPSNKTYAVAFGVGSSGSTRGVYDSTNGDWIIYRNSIGQTGISSSKRPIVINGTNFSVDASGNVKSVGTGYLNNLSMTGWVRKLTSDWSSSNQKATFIWTENSVTGQKLAFGITNNGYHRGIYDGSDSRWIVVKYQSGQVVYNGLHSNFEIDAATILSGSTSISGGGITTGTTSISKSGWYPVAIAGWNANTRYALPARLYLSARGNGTGTVSWGIYNPGSSAQTPTLTAYVLWARGD